MARASKPRSRSLTVNQRVRVTITPAPFHVFASVRQLDVARLKRAARQRIEVGYFESECCRRMVHAVVRKGQVVKLELEPCEGTAPASPEIEQVARAALKRLGVKPGGGKVLPVPVERFVANAQGFTWEIWWCFRICCFGYCIFCCFDIGKNRGFWSSCRIDKRAP